MDPGNRYQVFGADAQGRLTHAGAHDAPRMSAKIARKLQRAWLAWRRLYLESEPSAQGSPLHLDAQDPERTTVVLYMHPIGRPSETKRYRVAE